MKDVTKNLLYILFTTILFIPLMTVIASPVNRGYSNNYINECVDDKSCMLLCAYTNSIRYTYEGVTPPGYDYYSSYIYYSFEENNFFVEWYSQETDLNKAKNNYNLFYKKYIFHGKTVEDKLRNNGQCPQNSYIDIKGAASEICFDNGDNFCINKKDAGTKFKGESTLEYNYENQIGIYFENWFPTLNYSCEKFRNLNINIQEDFITDFKKNFLYGYGIPNFLLNSNSYVKGLQEVENRISNLTKKCDAEVNNSFDNGNISEQARDKLLELNKKAENDLNNQLEEAEQEIASGSVYVPTLEDLSCSSLLGSPDPKPDGKNYPAYYLTFAFKIIRYIAIIILIVLSTIDFLSAVASHDDDELKKAMNKTIIRFVLCIIIFLLPTLIAFILRIIDEDAINLCINTH